jgi:8-oxo-dGTP pyrophosphatase MutT (NUDIX family)
MRGTVYADVWKSVAKLETLDASPTSRPSGGTPEIGRSRGTQRPRATSARRPAHGGVVFDSRGRVLLFRPRGGFGGYAWTFPKGRPDRGEEPEQTAVREVREETGVEATIVAPIPGSFEGDTTDTTYYLMRFVRDTKHLGPEAEAIQWALPQAAVGLIAQTRSVVGRQRDLAVLKAAVARSDELPGGGR